MTLPIPKNLALIAIFACLTVSGCSQQVSFDDKNGFQMPYPKTGDDIAPTVEAIFNFWGDPRRSNSKFTGIVKIHVVSARVLQADPLVPRPDNVSATLYYHAHSIITLPSGQVIETDHLDSIMGMWYQGHLRGLSIASCIPGINYYGVMPIEDIGPSVVPKTQDAINAAHTRFDMKYAVNDPVSLYDLLDHLQQRDITTTKYDVSYWEKANQIALPYADAAFGPENGPTPWLNNVTAPNSDASQQSTPVAASPAEPTPVPVQGPTFTINVTNQISITIPMTDPNWPAYRAFLPGFQFNWTSWSNMARQGATHVQLEKRLYVEINEDLKRGQKYVQARNQPIINSLTQAAYIAQQPGATEQQKDEYEKLRAKDDPILERSTRSLTAMQMLLRAIQDDITAQSGSSSL